MPRTPGSGRGTPSRGTGGASSSGSAHPEAESGNEDHASDIPEQVPAPSARRMIASLVENAMEFDYDRASRVATSINRLYTTGACRTWSHIPLSTRNQMFERFQQYFQWDPTLDSRIRLIWEKKYGKCYNDNLSSARNRADDLCNKDGRRYDRNDPNRDMNLLRPFVPNWLDANQWNTMIDGWNSDHWKSVSVTARSNRMTEIDGEISKHTNGSISFGQTASRLTRAKGGVPPSGIELYDHTHKKRRSGANSTSSESGEYVTSRCSRFASEYRTSAIERYGEDPANHPPLDIQLWHDVTGGTKRGRSFGFGNHPDPTAILGGSSSSCGASSSSQQHVVENLTSQVEELKQDLAEQRAENERRREEDARFRAQYEEMCTLVRSLSQNTPRPPL